MSAMNAMTMRPLAHLRLRPRLHLCIASGHVRLDLLQPVRSTSVRMAWRMLWAYLRGQDHMYYRVVGSETVTGPINTHTLQATVQQALQQLARSSHTRLAGCALTVEVGPALAHVGLLELEGAVDGAGGPRLSGADLHAYAQAWVTHTWGLEPANCVIRCQPMQRGGQYLLVCVDQFVPAQLAQLCLQQGLQFADCTAALVTVLSRAPVGAAGAVLVLTEELTEDAATRAPGGRIAQWVVMDQSGPLSVCRTWLGADTKVQQDDELTHMELTHMAHRLCAQHRFAKHVAVLRHTWPLPAQASALGGTP
jgi:hypothetical protein